MKIPNISAFKGIVGLGKAFVLAHRPEMLLGTSVIAGIGSTVLAAKGGYEAGQKVLKAEFLDLDLDSEEGKTNPLTTKEKAELTWQCYVPAGLALATSVGATTGLHLVHVKDKKALVAAGAAALDEMKEIADQYRNEVIGVASEDRAREIENKIHEKRADKDGVSRIMNTDGEIEELYLVRDAYSGRDIWANEQRIADALNSMNRWIVNEGDCELNHFYGVAGFGNIPIGDDVGWSGEPVTLSWDLIQRDDGRPVRRFTFREQPKESYAKA